MKKYWTLNHYLLIPFFALSLALAGCSGDDGARGPEGERGERGPVGDDTSLIIPGSGTPATYSMPEHESIPMYLDALITDVVLSEPTLGEINVEIEFDIPDYDRDAARVEITFAMWDGDRRTWVNMLPRSVGDAPKRVIRGGNLRVQPLNRASSAVPFSWTLQGDGINWGTGPINFGNGPVWRLAAEGEVERYATGTSDTLEYRTYVEGIISEIDAYTWADEVVFRIGVTSRTNTDQPERFNAVAYFTGDGNMVTDPETELSDVRLMDMASCTSCHGESLVLRAHAAQRHDPNVCTSCHNDFTFDRGVASVAEPEGWASLDMMVIIHRIHAGIEGYTVDSKPFDHIGFPDWTFRRGKSNDTGLNRGVRNCTACHLDTHPLDNVSWNAVSTEACLTCHGISDIYAENFPSAYDPEHTAMPTGNDCASCHSGIGTPRELHGIPSALGAFAASADYQLDIHSVSNAVAGSAPTVTWGINDADGAARTLTGLGFFNELRIGIGWGYGDDWTNDGISRANGAAGDPAFIEVTADNTLINGSTATTTLSALPANAEAGRLGYVTIMAADAGGSGIVAGASKVKPNTVAKNFTLGAEEITEFDIRRQIVDADKCLSCHTNMERHNTWANDDMVGCVTCHNAGSLSRDGSALQGNVDFMFLMHAIHATGDRIGSNTAGDQENRVRERLDRRRDHGYTGVTYPRSVLDCTACHLEGTYDKVDTGKRLGVIADKGKDLYEAGTGVNSAYASVCYSCHQDNNESVRAHFMSMGANMVGNASHEDYAEGLRAESCNLCHFQDL